MRLRVTVLLSALCSLLSFTTFGQTRAELLEQKVNSEHNAWLRKVDSAKACRQKFRDALTKAKNDTEIYYLIKYAQSCQDIDYSADFGIAIANALLKQKKFKNALEELTKAAQSKERWMFDCEQDVYDEGPDDQIRLADAKKSYAEVLALRAGVWSDFGYPHLGIADLRRAVEIDPKNASYTDKLNRALSASKGN